MWVPSYDYLEHHGIAGQKWGKRNGPPYPLDYNDHSPAQKRKNPKGELNNYVNNNPAPKRKYHNSHSSEKKTDNYQFSGKSNKSPNSTPKSSSSEKVDHHANDGIDKTKVATTAATAVFSPLSTVTNIGVHGAQAAIGAAKSKKYEKERENLETDKATGLKIKDKNKEYSIKDDAARVNPSVNNFNTNTKSNCMLCTTTYDLRRRGFDVTANTASIGYTTKDIKRWYPKAQMKEYTESLNRIQQKTVDRAREKGRTEQADFYASTFGRRTKETRQRIASDLAKQGDGARGNLMTTWTMGGGHSVAYENIGGKTKIIDSQSNTIYSLDSFLKQTRGNVTITRLDNVDFDPKAIKEASRS